jgi:hypothetical protein
MYVYVLLGLHRSSKKERRKKEGEEEKGAK